MTPVRERKSLSAPKNFKTLIIRLCKFIVHVSSQDTQTQSITPQAALLKAVSKTSRKRPARACVLLVLVLL